MFPWLSKITYSGHFVEISTHRAKKMRKEKEAEKKSHLSFDNFIYLFFLQHFFAWSGFISNFFFLFVSSIKIFCVF